MRCPYIAPGTAEALASAGGLAFLPMTHREVVDVGPRTVCLVFGCQVRLSDIGTDPELQHPFRTSAGTRDFNQQRPLGPWKPGLTQVQARISTAGIAANEGRGKLEVCVIAARRIKAIDCVHGRGKGNENPKQPIRPHGVSSQRLQRLESDIGQEIAEDRAFHDFAHGSH